LKQKLLNKLSIGQGGFLFFKRQDLNVLVVADKEFIIPNKYSDDARLELESLLWKESDFTRMQYSIQQTRLSWVNIKKKDKLYLMYKYISSLDVSTQTKIFLCGLITVALLLKMIKPDDVVYENFKITRINETFFNSDTYTNIQFSYDYSSPNKLQTTITDDD
jgi:hypothetical protein